MRPEIFTLQRINFGIALDSLYHEIVSAEIFLLYITFILIATLKLHLFCLHYITLSIPDAD